MDRREPRIINLPAFVFPCPSSEIHPAGSDLSLLHDEECPSYRTNKSIKERIHHWKTHQEVSKRFDWGKRRE